MPKKKSLSSVEAQELLEPVSETANSPSEDTPDTASNTHLLDDTETLTTSGQPDFDVENEHSVVTFEDMPDMETAAGSDYKDLFQEPENAAAADPEPLLSEYKGADTPDASQLASEASPVIGTDPFDGEAKDNLAAPIPDRRRDRVLTIDARSEIQTETEREAAVWHEIQNAYRIRHILTGTLDGVEKTASGLTLAVANYKGFRVAIPAKEMMLYTGQAASGQEYAELMGQLNRILNSRLGSEIDFIIKGYDNDTRSAVASRKEAMMRKRQTFYMDADEFGEPMIYEGRVVQARVVAVAEKVIRVEVFGVECTLVARDLSWEWIGNAHDHFSVGDRILVRVTQIDRTDLEHLSIRADARSASASNSRENLKKCILQSKYVGRVTDIRNGVVFIRLNNGVNAIAHTCLDRRTPGKRDDVSFAVTRLDEEQGIAVGLITRIIKQNL